MALFVVLIGVARSLGVWTGEQSSSNFIAGPDFSPLDFQAVSSGNRHYVAVRGVTEKRHKRLAIWEISSSDTAKPVPLPSPPDNLLDGGVPVVAINMAGRPCFSFANPGPRLRFECFDRESRSWSAPGGRNSPVDEREAIVDLKTFSGRLYSLQRTPDGESSYVRVLSSGEWRQVGTALPGGNAQVLFDEPQSLKEGSPSVMIQSDKGRFSDRYVVELHQHSWHRRTGILKGGSGAAITGSIRVGRRSSIMPVVDASSTSKPWQFSLYKSFENRAWRKLTSRPLNENLADAQGGVHRVRDAVWASWIETKFSPRRPQFFAYVAKVDRDGPDTFAPIKVWSGELAFATLPVIVAAESETFVIYPSAFRGDPSRMQIRIRSLEKDTRPVSIIPAG